MLINDFDVASVICYISVCKIKIIKRFSFTQKFTWKLVKTGLGFIGKEEVIVSRIIDLRVEKTCKIYVRQVCENILFATP